jgi:hypothetical protein
MLFDLDLPFGLDLLFGGAVVLGAGKFPTPANVTLAGVAKIGAAGGTP